MKRNPVRASVSVQTDKTGVVVQITLKIHNVDLSFSVRVEQK